jgi:CheY-like chemotaxis protein
MPRILVVDDEPAIRLLMRRTLTSAGYEVDEAPDGAAALEIYSREPSTLVVTDLVMPGKEGLETIIELRRRDPAVRIIAISGGGEGQRGLEQYLKTARLLGAIRVLQKPFSPQELLDAVAEVLAPRA